MNPVYVVMMENGRSDFQYFLGIFSSRSKAEAVSQYELERRRAMSVPGEVTPRIFATEVNRVYSQLDVDTLENIFNRT